jgi:hypothetical protein
VHVVVAIGVFVLFTGSFLAVALGMTAFGRWRGWGDYFAPDIARPPRSEWPWLCRLHLYHRWCPTGANRADTSAASAAA